MKTIDAEKCWALVAQMGWNKKADSSAMAKDWWGKLRNSEMKDLGSFVDARVSELGSAVNLYEKANRTDLEVGSDDGFSDLRYHVVGLGQKEFEACMKNPLLLQERHRKGDYRESFAYVFLEPDPPRTEEQKKETLAKLMAKIEEVDKQARTLDAGLTLLRDKMHTLSLLAATVKEDIEEKEKETA